MNNVNESYNKTFIITTQADADGKYTVPEHESIPVKFWGRKVSKNIISWVAAGVPKEQLPVVNRLTGKSADNTIAVGTTESEKQVIRFTVIGDPLAQKRHRSRAFTDGAGNTQVRNYDPSEGNKADFLSIVMASAPAVPFDCPIRLDCTFYFPRPKSHYRTGANAHLLKDNAPEWKISKPDRDNLDKFVLDALHGVYWRDDSIVCAGEIQKKYDVRSRTEIVLTVL